MDTISLFELNQYIKQVLALNFEQYIWIEAEISQAKNSRGHWYIELIQKDADQQIVIAQSNAVIWAADYRNLERSTNGEIVNLLKSGTHVKLLIEVTYHERYGLKLLIRNIDLQFTLGDMELQKRATLERLEKEGLLSLNKLSRLPTVLQNLAIISSPTAAGYIDFLQHLKQNEYGFDFNIRLFEASMQGAQVRKDICNHLSMLSESDYDCIIIIRGGGSRLDLSDFDDYEVSRQIALSHVPVLTGIGHEIDLSIADLVAHTHFKTPTAVASFLISRTLDMELQLGVELNALYDAIQNELYRQSLTLTKFQASLHLRLSSRLEKENEKLTQWKERLSMACQVFIDRKSSELQILETHLFAIDHRAILKRGYSLLQQDGKYITKIDQVNDNSPLKQILSDGVIHSKLIKKEHNGQKK